MKKIIILLSLMGLMGCAQSNTIEIEGRVAMKGSSIHTYLAIEDKSSHKSYKIQNKKSFNLMQKQNQILKVKARLIKEAVGPGFPAVIEIVEVN